MNRRRPIPAKLSLRLTVVKGVLIETITLEQGARRLRMPPRELEQLVAGARRKVIDVLGERALDVSRDARM